MTSKISDPLTRQHARTRALAPTQVERQDLPGREAADVDLGGERVACCEDRKTHPNGWPRNLVGFLRKDRPEMLYVTADRKAK